MSEKPLSYKVEYTIDWVGDSFLLLARRLRDVQDETPEMFASVAKLNGIGLRKAFYLCLSEFDVVYNLFGKI